jgi:hypothetical protein
MNRLASVLAVSVLLAGAVWAAGDPVPAAPKADPPALAGRWLMTLPAGFKYEAVIEAGEEFGLYRIKCEAHNLQGIYDLRGKALAVAKPFNPNRPSLAWEVRGPDELVLTRQDDQRKVGADYRGATLVRIKPMKAVPPGR